MIASERILSLPRYLEYAQFQGISFVSRIIQKMTRDQDSHSAVIDREAPGPKQLIEQWPHTGWINSYMDYNDFSGHTQGTPYEIWSLEVPPECYDFVMNFYRESAARKKEYDWSGIMAFGLKGQDDPDKTFCSEEMVTPLCQWFKWDRINPAVVSPGIFRMIIQAKGAVLTQKGLT
jgi:hypothetical protein